MLSLPRPVPALARRRESLDQSPIPRKRLSISPAITAFLPSPQKFNFTRKKSSTGSAQQSALASPLDKVRNPPIPQVALPMRDELKSKLDDLDSMPTSSAASTVSTSVDAHAVPDPAPVVINDARKRIPAVAMEPKSQIVYPPSPKSISVEGLDANDGVGEVDIMEPAEDPTLYPPISPKTNPTLPPPKAFTSGRPILHVNPNLRQEPSQQMPSPRAVSGPRQSEPIIGRLPSSPTVAHQGVWLCSPPPKSPIELPALPDSPHISRPMGQDGLEIVRSLSDFGIQAPPYQHPSSRYPPVTTKKKRPFVTRSMSTGRLAHEFDSEGRIICLSAHSDRVLQVRNKPRSSIPTPSSPVIREEEVPRSFNRPDKLVRAQSTTPMTVEAMARGKLRRSTTNDWLEKGYEKIADNFSLNNRAQRSKVGGVYD